MSRKLYPDLEKAGGLPQVLQPILERLGGGLLVSELEEPFVVYASVTRADRHSQVMIAAEHRAFSVDFWCHGVQYGHGWAGSPEDVAIAIHAFQVDRLNATTLESRFGWVRVYELAFVHESGPAAFVEDAWRKYVESLGKEHPGSSCASLLPLIRACMERPRLYRLLPFTSMNRLCFSRTTGYPYTSECPPAVPVRDGWFAFQQGGTGARTEGDASSIALALEAALAPDCPAAVHGTAKDLPRPA